MRFPSISSPPARAGVYAYFLAPEAALDQIANPGGDAVYVGRSSNLSQREFDAYFAAGNTGFSTLRRTLGALLRDTLNLRCRPR